MADTIPSQIGRYEIVRHLGRGGMGVVYLARDPLIERQVAVKLLRSLDDEDAQQRFQREIRIAGALNHHNIVRIYDAGTHEGQPFVAMEFVPGETVADLIKRAAPLDLDRKLELLIDLTEGLGFAHARGVIHRDIKPSNLIVDEHGRLKILDFGIARLADAGRTSASAVGTPSYMAPEQLRGEVVDARADLFACGVVVYEVVAYRQPFTGPSHHALYHAILNAEPEPLTDAAPGTPASLNTFIRTALAKSPADRFHDAQALGDALRTIRAALTADETIVIARLPRPHPAGHPPPTPDSGSGGARLSGPKPVASRRLAELRERQRSAAKDEARRALAEGRLADALEAAERALVLDEQDGGAQELAELARQAIDRAESGRLLAEARQHLEDGDLTQAQQVIDRLKSVGSETPQLTALEARLAQLAHERELARRVRELVEDARRRAEVRDLDGAQAAVTEALAIDGQDAEALTLRTAIDTRLRERQAEREWHARARQAVSRASDLFDGGQLTEAISLLEEFAPAHPETTALLAEVRARQTQVTIEQRRRAQEEQRREERRQGVDRAEALLEARDGEAALRLLADLRSRGFVDEQIDALEQRAADLKLAVATERHRAAVLSRGLEHARAAMDRRDPAAALLVLEQLADQGFGTPAVTALADEAEALQHQIAAERQERLERERRAARLAAGLDQVRAALRTRDADGALVAIRFLRADGFDEQDLDVLEKDAQAALLEIARERQEAIGREGRTARLAKGLADVRGAMERRDPDAAFAAIRLLRKDGFDEEEVAAAEREAESLQRDLTSRRQGEIEERHAERLAKAIEDVEDAIRRREADRALAALDLLRRDGFDLPEVAALERQAQALRRQIIAEQYEQRERERRAARLAAAMAEIRAVLEGRDPDAALAAVGVLRREGFTDAPVAALEEEAKALQEQIARERYEQLERERREARLTSSLAEVRAALDRNDADAALAAVDLLRRDGFTDAALVPLAQEATVLRQRIARERLEQLERERREARLAEGLENVRAALDRGDADAALGALGLLRREGFTDAPVAALEQEAKTLHEQTARRQYEQLERERRAARLAEGLEKVRAALVSRDADAAFAALGLLRRDGFTDAAVVALERDAKALQDQIARERYEVVERERRAARLAAGLAEVSAAVAMRDLDAATAALGLLRRDGFTADLADVERSVKTLEEELARERREHIERERRTARVSRDAREVHAAIERRDPDAALTLLGALARDGLAVPDHESLANHARDLRERIARERADAAARAAGESRAVPETPPPIAKPRRPAWAIPVALVSLVAGIALVSWLLWRGAVEPGATQTSVESPSSPSPGPSSPAASMTPVPGASSGVTASGTPAASPGSGSAPALDEAARLERRGDLRGATRVLAEFIGKAPQSPEASTVMLRLSGLVTQARQRAEQARVRAVTANATTSGDFSAGEGALDQGQRASSRGSTTQAVSSFLDAEAAFTRAAETKRATATPEAGAAPGPAQVPSPLPHEPAAAPPSPAPSPASSSATTVPPPAPAAPTVPTSPAPSPGPDTSADERIIEAVVRRYFVARSQLDVAGVQEVYPGVPIEREREYLRSNERTCAEFSEHPLGMEVLRLVGTTATVQARVQVNCRPKAGKALPPRTANIVITLEKAGGAYRITQVNRPDQAR